MVKIITHLSLIHGYKRNVITDKLHMYMDLHSVSTAHLSPLFVSIRQSIKCNTHSRIFSGLRTKQHNHCSLGNGSLKLAYANT